MSQIFHVMYLLQCITCKDVDYGDEADVIAEGSLMRCIILHQIHIFDIKEM